MQVRDLARPWWLLFFLALTFVGGTIGAAAHEIRPSIADFTVRGDGGYEIRVRTNLEAMIAGIGSEHDDTDEAANADQYNGLRALESQELAERFAAFEGRFRELFQLELGGDRVSPGDVSVDIPPVGDTDIARDSTLIVRGDIPAGADVMVWAWPREFGASVIRMETAPGQEEGYSAYLSAGEVSEEIPLSGADERSVWQVIGNYIVIGFAHIIPKGLDHILFVVGLFLLSVRLSALVWQISAFTLAHTVTLALGALGYITISPSIVEPLIALSIAYVAIENIFTDRLHRWRPLIVFAFGLLHGLGFAGVLGEIGLSPSHFAAGLIAFNVGVELGQLSVIAICFCLFGYWFGQEKWYRQRIVIPLSLLISIIALWWVYERVVLA